MRQRDTIFSLHNPQEENQADELNSQRMAEAARDYHEALQSRDHDPTLEPDPTKLDAVLNNIHTCISPEQKSVLVRPLSWPDIHIALSDSSNDKAAGLNGIPQNISESDRTL